MNPQQAVGTFLLGCSLFPLGCSVGPGEPKPEGAPNLGAAAGTTGQQASAGSAAQAGGAGGQAPAGNAGGAVAAGGLSVGGLSGAGGGAGASGVPLDVPRGMSAGCGKANTNDEPGQYEVHDLDVAGVDPYWLNERTPFPEQAPYTFTKRSYAIRLPTGYDPNQAYPLIFQGGGCGSTNGKGGHSGGDKLLPDNAASEAITVGLSYVYPQGAGACFQDEGANTMELPYFDAAYQAITENYCINREKVFIGGYSSGAWLAYTISFARAGIVRGMGAGAGGIREQRPAPSNTPFAAFLVTGEDDGPNPVHKTKEGTTCSGSEGAGCWKGELICGTSPDADCYDTGSAAARDAILARNGCVGSETKQYGQWSDCKQYTGCPAAFPVVYCMPAGGHTSGEERHNPGIWDFWRALPAVP